MGRASKRKGQEGEREFARLVGGRRIPLSGAQSGFENDVLLPNGWRAEVKRRKSGFKQLYEWIEDEREKPDVIALRVDRKPWIVCMTMERFMELIGERREQDVIQNQYRMDRCDLESSARMHEGKRGVP